MLTLRPYQEKVNADIRIAFKDGARRVIAVMPCGSGKTVVFTKIAQGASLKNKAVTIIAHRKELITQCSDKLKKFCVDHGIIKAGFAPQYEKNIQVASVQTLHKREGIIKPDTFIYDECHHSQSKTAQEILNRHSSALLLGVTASPIFANGRTMGGYYDRMVIGPTVRELIDDGYLVDTHVYAPPPIAQLEGVDYENLTELEGAMNKRTITGDAIDHYKRLAAGMSAIVTVVNVKHGQDVAEQFREAGFSFYSIHGGMKDVERDKLLADFHAGRIQGLISCDLIGEGTDVPRARVLIKLRPTHSLCLNIQHDGRVNRPFYADGFDLATREGRLAAIAASDKPFAIIFDHVANYYFHGWPDDEWQWSLTKAPKRKPREVAFQVSQCAVCYRCFKGVACPHCGSERAAQARKLLYTDGELKLLKKEDIKRAKEEEERVKKQKIKDRKTAKTLPELIAFAIKYKYDNPTEWAKKWQRMRGKYSGNE